MVVSQVSGSEDTEACTRRLPMHRDLPANSAMPCLSVLTQNAVTGYGYHPWPSENDLFTRPQVHPLRCRAVSAPKLGAFLNRVLIRACCVL